MVTREPPDPPFNPYAAPAAIPREDDSEAAALRLPSLSREAAVRLIGATGYILAFPLLILGVVAVMIATDFLGQSNAPMNPAAATLLGLAGLTCLALGTAVGVLFGRDMRRFRRRSWVVWSTSMLNLLAMFILVAAPLICLSGGPIAALGLLLTAALPTAVVSTLLSPRTTRLFRPEYRKAVALTPRLRPRLSLRAGLLLALVLGLTAAGVALLVESLTD